MTAGHDAGGQVARLLGQLENDLDAAFATAGALAAALPQGRAEARLSAVVGQHALELLNRAAQTIGQGGDHIVQSPRTGEKPGFDADDHGDDRARRREATGLDVRTPPRVAA